MSDPCSPEAFEARYAAEEDPWSFATSPYEASRYQVIIDQLGPDRYATAYEPACSVGVLTERLADRCDRLLAVDVSPSAVERAAARCRGLDGVEVRVGSITDPPPGQFDLVVMSEVGYYFERPQLEEIATSLADALAPEGRLVACHWRGHSVDHLLHGSEVHARLGAVLDDRLHHRSRQTEPGFFIDTWIAR